MEARVVAVIALWRRFRDFYLSLRTHAAIAERECRHDGTDPKCSTCIRNEVGW